MIKRKIFIILALCFCANSSVIYANDQVKTNIILIFVDDLGMGDLACFGNNWIPTPHIDSLARDGVKMEMSYVTNPPCSPSRSALMTGMYAQKFGKFGMARGLALPKDSASMAEFMRKAGYVTGQIGKWDLGSHEQGPHQIGFMEVAKWTEGKGKYFCKTPEGDFVYRTELDGDRAVEFIDRNKDKPFFLYFSPFAIHAPLTDTPEKFTSRIRKKTKSLEKQYGGAVAAVDDQVGKILKALSKHKLDKNTLIVLSSDNGPHYNKGGSSAPYRGGKGADTQYEGWVHVPTIVRWPGHIPSGRTYKGLSCTLDFYASFAEVSGQKVPDYCDGKSLLPYLKGEKSGDVHESISWYSADPKDHPRRHLSAVRWKQWRALMDQKTKKWQLFDLHNDPQERKDLAAQNSEVLEEMKKMHEKFVSELPSLDSIPAYDDTWATPPKGWGWHMTEGESE